METSVKIVGIPASPGIAIGPVMLYEPPRQVISRAEISPEEVPQEWRRVEEAFDAARIQTSEHRQATARRAGEEEAAIFDAHLLMLEDEELLADIRMRVFERRQNAASAIWDAIEAYRSQMLMLDDEYLRARAADLEDIGAKVLVFLHGMPRSVLSSVTSSCVVAARDLLPSDTASLNPDVTLALITEDGGPTAHTAILARQLRLPAVVGATGLLDALRLALADHSDQGDAVTVAVDGEAGTIEIRPDAEALAYYHERQRAFALRAELLTGLVSLPATTPDGHHVELVANIGSQDEAADAAGQGAVGVGLFRTEFLFHNRPTAPTEDEQVAAYTAASAYFPMGWVTIRTLDIGGDKVIPYLPLPSEENPFLGLRGLRLCLAPQFRQVFTTQLRAILRAAVQGARLRIMFPMVNNIEELRRARSLLRAAAESLESEGVPAVAALARLQVGAMVETPAAALSTDLLSEEVDFFSIGTNDLTQYILAVDRMNAAVAPLCTSFAPAVLRAIHAAIAGAHRKGRPIAMCGEMAGDPRATPLLLGLELDEFSASPASLSAIKQVARACTMAKAHELMRQVYRLSTATEVTHFLESAVAEVYKGDHRPSPATQTAL